MDFVIGIQLMGPDGQVVIDEREWSHLRDEAPIKPSFIMAKHRLNLDIEQGDPIGEYTIIANVRDLVSGAENNISYSFQVLGL